MMLGLYLAAAVVLGSLPAGLLWGRGILMVDGAQLRARLAMDTPGNNRRRRRWWKSLAVWLDPVRGAAVGWVLVVGLRAESGELEQAQYLAIQFAGFIIMLGSAWWQSTGRGKEGMTPVPLVFLGGLMVGACGPVIGLSALAVSLMALFASQSIALALIAMAATTLVAGWLLLGPSITLLVVAAAAGLPWVKGFVLRHQLVLALRG